MPRFSRVTPRVPVADLQRTIEFYGRKLGFHIDVIFPERNPTFCILARQETQVGFYTHTPDRGPVREPGGVEFYFDVENVQGLHRALVDRVPIEWGPEVYFYRRREFAIRDPDGYLLIFSEATTDPVTCREE